MTFVITQPCIDVLDQSCIAACPVNCIHFNEGQDRMLYIDPVECIDCGDCRPVCPVNAIFPEHEVPADQRQFIEINAGWYQDKAAARAKVAVIPALAVAEEAALTAPAPASGQATGVPAAPAPVAQAMPPSPALADVSQREPEGYKYGENGVEGKCAICGQYVIKGGTKFRAKSVLCPECAGKRATLGNPHHASAGRR